MNPDIKHAARDALRDTVLGSAFLIGLTLILGVILIPPLYLICWAINLLPGAWKMVAVGLILYAFWFWVHYNPPRPDRPRLPDERIP